MQPMCVSRNETTGAAVAKSLGCTASCLGSMLVAHQLTARHMPIAAEALLLHCMMCTTIAAATPSAAMRTTAEGVAHAAAGSEGASGGYPGHAQDLWFVTACDGAWTHPAQ
jgi:hypothetical protein